MKQWFYIFAFVTQALVGLTACGDPCKDLSNQICGCERNTNDRNTCLARVSLLVGQYSSNPNSAVEQAGRNYCANLMSALPSDPQHVCDALTLGDLQPYGLSKEPATD